jgi:sec-independent protein translocase protein TatA
VFPIKEWKMGLGSIWHWIVLGLVVLLLFGKGRISDIMGDVAKGIKSFKKGMAEEPEAPAPRVSQSATIDAQADVKQDSKS